MEGSLDELRDAIDEQYQMLLETHADLFANVESGFEEGVDASDEMMAESLEALDEQLQMVLEAHEELETQSLEAVEQFAEQVDEVQAQMEDMQAQMQDASERALETIEA
jgi:uncharacterized phage infection (PIP) family protein YhgE